MWPFDSVPEGKAFTTRSRIGEPSRWPRNPGVQSPQSKGDSPWMSTRQTLQSPISTAWVTRSPSSPCISMPPPPACWTSSTSSTHAPVGTTAFAPAPSGCRGASDSTWVRLARRCAWRALPTLPRLAQALARGELSYSKVRALTRGDPGDRGAPASHRACRHRRARRAHRPRLATHGSQGGAGRGHPAAHQPCPLRVSGRRRHRNDPRTSVARGRCAPPESPDGGP